MGSGEFAFLERLRHRLGDRAHAGEVFVGDDAAVLLPAEGRLLVATDTVVEGVHFDRSIGSLRDAGWKAVAVNVSDIAAMGGRARHAVAALSAPPGTDLDELFEGMLEAAASYGVELVGGDLSGGDQIVLAVTVLGDCDVAGPVLRSGARASDEIWVTGSLGASAAGLRALQAGDTGALAAPLASALAAAYQRPIARPAEGEAAALAGATAMIDVSDGLSADLAHLARASEVGIRLHDVPVAAGATEADALGGGEDYELVFTAPAGSGVLGHFAAAGLRPPILIGGCVDDPAVFMLRDTVLQPRGFEHGFDA
jgi:thiamine-monophosphate kinase